MTTTRAKRLTKIDKKSMYVILYLFNIQFYSFCAPILFNYSEWILSLKSAAKTKKKIKFYSHLPHPMILFWLEYSILVLIPPYLKIHSLKKFKKQFISMNSCLQRIWWVNQNTKNYFQSYQSYLRFMIIF